MGQVTILFAGSASVSFAGPTGYGEGRLGGWGGGEVHGGSGGVWARRRYYGIPNASAAVEEPRPSDSFGTMRVLRIETGSSELLILGAANCLTRLLPAVCCTQETAQTCGCKEVGVVMHRTGKPPGQGSRFGPGPVEKDKKSDGACLRRGSVCPASAMRRTRSTKLGNGGPKMGRGRAQAA